MIDYASNPEYILYVGLIVAMDAIAAIPFAYLRENRKAMRFSAIKLINVIVNIALNLYFLWLAPKIAQSNPDAVWLVFYRPEINVGYIFIANVISSAVTLLLLLPELLKTRLKLEIEVWKKMVRFAYPLAFIILLGMVNEVADKLLMKHLLTDESLEVRKTLLGEYGANFKLAVLMSIFIQMFRFAAEPFFFAQAREKNARPVYAEVMKYFIIFGWLIFLGVMLFIDILKYFIDSSYHDGLAIVPIILIAKLFQGVFYNLSIWYKLTDLTRMGAWIALAGTAITLLANFILVPRIGYQGAAIGQLLCYGSMAVLSFFLGRKYFKVGYPLKRIGLYSAFALAIYWGSSLVTINNNILSFVVNGLLLLMFFIVAVVAEKKNFHKFSS
jgi:O-antigen/teichoic acid export membrane protein